MAGGDLRGRKRLYAGFRHPQRHHGGDLRKASHAGHQAGDLWHQCGGFKRLCGGSGGDADERAVRRRHQYRRGLKLLRGAHRLPVPDHGGACDGPVRGRRVPKTLQYVQGHHRERGEAGGAHGPGHGCQPQLRPERRPDPLGHGGVRGRHDAGRTGGVDWEDDCVRAWTEPGPDGAGMDSQRRPHHQRPHRRVKVLPDIGQYGHAFQPEIRPDPEGADWPDFGRVRRSAQTAGKRFYVNIVIKAEICSKWLLNHEIFLWLVKNSFRAYFI